ncbi:MAG: hypothetical protein WA908_05000 [Pontixanthobacter sp.]
MRVAVFSNKLSLSDKKETACAYAPVGGRMVAEYQLDIARDLGCGHIIWLREPEEALPRTVVETARSASIPSSKIAMPGELVGIISGDDELIFIADGLFTGSADLQDLDSPRILTFDAEWGVPAGFERIDRTESWAGVMLLPGRLVNELLTLPDDIDIMSGLLRIALQNGVPCSRVPDENAVRKEWRLVRNLDDTAKMTALVAQRMTADATALMPIKWAAKHSASWLLSRWSQPARTVRLAIGLSATLMLAAIVLTAFGRVVGALIFILTSIFIASSAVALTRASYAVPRRSNLLCLHQLIIDCVLIAIIVVGAAEGEATHGLFAALVFVGLVRVLEAGEPHSAATFACERGTIAAILLTFAAPGFLTLGVQAYAVSLIILLLIRTHRRKL